MEVPDGDYKRYGQQYSGMKKTIKCRLVKVRDEQGNLQVWSFQSHFPFKNSSETFKNSD